MFFTPISYDEPVFRPPAEAYSAIIQATIGCSWNKCAFCEMYSSKKFRIRNFEEIKSDISALAQAYGSNAKKVFIADGDAMVLSTNKLIPILDEINQKFYKLIRISCYALPKNILSKSEQELKQLKEKGLKLIYIGIETGDEELLKLHNKGETYDSTLKGIDKAHKAGIDTSIMIINGMGGKKYSEQHARNSAKIINELNPKYLSTLTLSFPFGIEHFKSRINFEFKQQTIVELLQELRIFINVIDVNNVIFRSNHASNSLPLKGTLSKDKEKVLEQIEIAIKNTPKHLFPIETRAM